MAFTPPPVSARDAADTSTGTRKFTPPPVSAKAAPADDSGFAEISRPTADDNLELGAKNFYASQAAADALARKFPVSPDQLKEWHPTLWEKFRTGAVGRRLLGDTDTEREFKQNAGRSVNLGVLDAVNNPVNPFLPSAETKIGKALLGYFLYQNAKAAPADIAAVKQKFDEGDTKGAWGEILKTGLDATFAGLAVHGLATDALAPKDTSPRPSPQSGEGENKFTPPPVESKTPSEPPPAQTAPAEVPPGPAQPAAPVPAPATVQTDGTADTSPQPSPQRGEGEAAPPKTVTTIAGSQPRPISAKEITVQPDLMQFKRMDDPASGVNEKEKLAGKWDDYKSGNLLLWQPEEPAEYGLSPGQKYIVANGHHRFAFGTESGVDKFNAQVIREVDGYSAEDARRLGAEINIADGKGTIYDQAKYIRNVAATHGPDEAVAAARRIGARGRAAADIGTLAGADLYDSFINEQISPEVTRAIATAAPNDDAAQRLGIKYARAGKPAEFITNLIQATKLASGGTAKEIDLFGNDDSAMQEMEAQAQRAGALQKDLRDRLQVLAAGKKAEIAGSEGIDVKDPAAIPARMAQLKAELARWDNWPLQPDLVAKVKGETTKAPSAPSEPPQWDKREKILDAFDDGKIESGLGLTPNEIANFDLMNHLVVPNGWRVKDVIPSKYGSGYWQIEDPEGHPYKVSVRDHEASPVREQEFGASSFESHVKDANDPHEFEAGISKLESMLQKYHDSGDSTDAAREKQKAEIAAAKPVRDLVAEARQRLAEKEEAYAQGIRIGNGKPFTTENQRENARKSIEESRRQLAEAIKQNTSQGVKSVSGDSQESVLGSGSTKTGDEIKPQPAKPVNELFPAGETPFNLTKEEAPAKAVAKTQFGGETLAQDELFAIAKVVESKDPVKSADVMEQQFGAAKSVTILENQLATMAKDPKAYKSYTKPQRQMLDNVLALLRQRAQKSTPQITPMDAERYKLAKATRIDLKATPAEKAQATKFVQRMERLYPQIKGNRIEGMGGRMSAKANAAKVSRNATQAGEAKEWGGAQGEITQAIRELVTPAEPVKPGEQWFYGLRKAFNPTSLGDAAKGTATVLRYMLGQRYAAELKFDAAMGKFSRLFDKNTTPRHFVYDPANPLPPNWEIQRSIDSGDFEALTEREQQFAAQARTLLDAAIKRVQALKPNVLQKLHEFYFPRYWRKQDEAAARKLAQASRPFEGGKTFLKQRSLQLWEDALKQGLRPRYDNPVDALRAKLGEMEMFASALEAHRFEKEAGRRRFNYIFEQRPDGWTDYHDLSTDVYAGPVVTIQEAFDEQIRTKTREMFQSLGISEDRLANIGGQRWGWARENPEHVRTKFGGADFVFWHEFGHIMDFRYPDLRDTLGFKAGTGFNKYKSVTDDELRALADARGANKAYARKAEEKMANVFDAYLRAPELFREKAPTVWQNLQTWLAKHPEVAGPLNDIRPSLRLGAAETEKFVGGPILLGHWIVPEESANVLNNYLDPGLWGKAKSLRAIKTLGGLISNVRLISAFHGQMVGNDALASGLSLPLYDAMKAVADRNPALLKRGAKDLLLAPVRPFLALRQGSAMMKSLRDPKADIAALDRQLANLAVEANLRAGHANSVENATRRWQQALAETRQAIKNRDTTSALPAALDVFLQTPLAIGHEMMRPIMEWFVPRMKLGLAAPMIQRIMADNPGMDEWEIRAKLGKAADSVEERVGQVTYDNLFQSRAVKDTGQLALQAYGWHLTKEQMLWGAASDYFKAGKAMLKGQRPEITFRMSYLPALAMTHALIGGTIMYLLTGRRPEKLIDYLFPETGLVDAYGKPVRLALADFLKDYLGEWNAVTHGPKAVVEEWEHRLMPVWNELADMYRNKDFWNTKIFSERQFDEPEYQHVWTNLKEGAEYLANSSAPFSVKGAQRFTQALGPTATGTQQALAHFGPYFGFVPAPQALTQSPAELKAAEIMRANMEGLTMSHDQRTHAQAVAQLVQDLRTGRLDDDGALTARVRAVNVKDTAELKRIQDRVQWTPLEYQLHKLPLWQPGTGRDAMTVWDLMSPAERVQNVELFTEKTLKAYNNGKGKLDEETTSRIFKVLVPYLKQAQAEKSKVQSPKSNASGLSALRE